MLFFPGWEPDKGMGRPVRTCVGCFQKHNKPDLLRVARTPEGSIVPDRDHRREGRGVYLCPRMECILNAEKEDRIARHLDATVSADVYKELKQWCGLS